MNRECRLSSTFAMQGFSNRPEAVAGSGIWFTTATTSPHRRAASTKLARIPSPPARLDHPASIPPSTAKDAPTM